MPGDATWTINTNTEAAKEQTRAAILAAVTQVFELDIKPDAVENSPVKEGTNRRSIDTEVIETETGIQAQLFTQSGYGGYLELGTRKMAARPYMWPAFNKFIDRLKTIIGQNVRSIKPGMFVGPGQEK